ncbi:MAG: DUF2147 domain-containing protein [Chitinophagia bacterium]|jgi:uncharacterized protein (DUF2147 family)|nr:DUF2147 domain-containing protein [Chitinophagia bacterium]NCA31101.1 DUF2147 domain-containing protein [Chitinophagia bacterium]
MIKKSLIKTSLFIFILFFANNLFAQNDFIGRWLSPSKKGIVETYIQNNKLNGKLVWVKTERKDIYNADKSLRNREVKGLVMLNDFTWDAPQWVDGKIYDPEGGATYSSKMWLSDDKQTLNVRGYIGFSLLGRTEKFTKVK